MTNTSKIFGSSRPKKYWSQAINQKRLDRIFWIMVKSWVASNVGSKNLGQRNILGQNFWVNTKTWLRKKFTFKKIGSKKYFESRFYGRNRNLGEQKIENIKKLNQRNFLGHNFKFNTKI